MSRTKDYRMSEEDAAAYRELKATANNMQMAADALMEAQVLRIEYEDLKAKYDQLLAEAVRSIDVLPASMINVLREQNLEGKDHG